MSNISKLYIVGLSVLAIIAIGATTSKQGQCNAPKAMTDSHSEYIMIGKGGAQSIDISFEPDAAAATTTAVLGMQACSREDTDSCVDFDYDSDADGVPDTNLLDGTSIVKSGIRDISGFHYLRVFASTDKGGSTEEPEFTVCRRFN